MGRLASTRVVVAGDALIDLIVDRDGAIIAAPGGGQYNASRAMARLGAAVHFLGRISDDHFGRRLRSRLEADGVATDLVADTSDPTTLVLAEIGAGGAAHYHWYTAGTSVPGLTRDEARRCLDPAPDALHVGTLGLALEPAADAIAGLVDAMPTSTFVLVDPNCRPTAIADRERFRQRMIGVLERADVVKASDEDLAYLALADTPEASAAWLLAHGAGAVLVTQGAGAVRGYAASGEVVVDVPSVPVVDTVGAGDTFGGAFLVHWLEHGLGRDGLTDLAALTEALRLAARAAALTCARAGADPPDRADLGLGPSRRSDVVSGV